MVQVDLIFLPQLLSQKYSPIFRLPQNLLKYKVFPFSEPFNDPEDHMVLSKIYLIYVFYVAIEKSYLIHFDYSLACFFFATEIGETYNGKLLEEFERQVWRAQNFQ